VSDSPSIYLISSLTRYHTTICEDSQDAMQTGE